MGMKMEWGCMQVRAPVRTGVRVVRGKKEGITLRGGVYDDLVGWVWIEVITMGYGWSIFHFEIWDLISWGVCFRVPSYHCHIVYMML